MKFIQFIIGNKAQLFYALLVLIFNIVAVYYLFFYSDSKINLAQIIPTKEALVAAATKPFQDVMKKFVYIKPTPTSFPQPTQNPLPTEITPQPTQENDLIDCVGPDGKHVWLSQRDCDTFNNSWKNTKPTPVASLSAAQN